MLMIYGVREEKHAKMGSHKPTLKEIENLRHLLVQSALDKGFTNNETIRVSQRLDHLLNRYSNIIQKQN